VSICVRAGLPKPRGVPDTERIKDTKTLDYASTPLDANTVLPAVGNSKLFFCRKIEEDCVVLNFKVQAVKFSALLFFFV
jgi:hypothetical protein